MKSKLAKNWKLLLAIVLLLVAVIIFFTVYRAEKTEYESKYDSLNRSIDILNSSIAKNAQYITIQDKLPEAKEKIDASRLALYEHFPAELREEDQIMYVLYLESLFDTEISFSFSSAEPIVGLSDGATLAGVTLTVNYDADYQGFKDMVEYLSTDSRITSVRFASMNYDPETERATGTVTLLLYVMQSELLEYQPPIVAEPEAGKDNIFE